MEQKFCKKCLIREMGEDKYREMIEKHLDFLKEEDRASKNVCEERLLICGECNKLNAGTCLVCGCYVEIRAALKTGKCPSRKWR